MLENKAQWRSATPMGPGAASLSLLTAALWGGNAVATSFSVDVFPPFAVAGLRFAMATAFMLFWTGGEGSELRLRAGQRTPSLIAGVLLFLQIGTFTVGVALSSSSHATVLINTFPFWVVAIEHFVTHDARLTVPKALGLGVAGAGTVLLIVVTAETGTGAEQIDPPSLAGDAILLLSACLLAVKIAYTKRAVRSVEPGKLILWHNAIGTILFAVTTVIFEEVQWKQTTGPAWLGIAYQGVIVGGFCFAVQAHLLRRYSASQVAVYSFGTPIFGVILAVLLRGDALSPWLLVAVLSVTAGIYLVNRSAAPARQR